ncbi:hypothetical protein K474DRAFT_1709882 [Panus rudis PR-1116 ss-1]|nr:hypothetical protein K474DRAFT_1709882 [Panus rudis PR-1116 ss-1]
MHLSAFCIVALASLLAPAAVAVPVGTNVARADMFSMQSALYVQPHDNAGDRPTPVIPTSQHYEDKRAVTDKPQPASGGFRAGLRKLNPVSAVNRYLEKLDQKNQDKFVQKWAEEKQKEQEELRRYAPLAQMTGYSPEALKYAMERP